MSFPWSCLCGATCAEALALHCFRGGGSRAEGKPWGFRGLSLEPVCPGPSSDSQPPQRQGWTPQGGEESPRPCSCRRSPALAVTCLRCPPCTPGSTFLVSTLFTPWVSGALGSVGLSLVHSGQVPSPLGFRLLACLVGHSDVQNWGGGRLPGAEKLGQDGRCSSWILRTWGATVPSIGGSLQGQCWPDLMSQKSPKCGVP